MSSTGRPPSFTQWLVDLRRSVWVPVTVSVLLTLLMLAFGRTTSSGRIAVLFLTNTIVSFSIGTMVMLVFGMVLPRVRKPGHPLPLRLLVDGLAIAIATVIGTDVAARAIAVLVPSAHFIRDEALKVALPIAFTTTIVTVALGRAKEGRTQATERSEIAERERLRAELVALKARVQPHFLFNSLNTVASLIEEDPKAAERAVIELAALFRYTLDASLAASVPLRQEMEAVRRYLRFEQLRFEERLKVEVEVTAEAEDVLVPPLLLQPLVENAVVHGVSARKEGGRVRVTARVEGDLVVIAIDDDGPGPRGDEERSTGAGTGTGTGTSRGSGTAMRDLTTRLALSYDGAATIETGRGDLAGFSVRLVLPVRGPIEMAPAQEAKTERAE